MEKSLNIIALLLLLYLPTHAYAKEVVIPRSMHDGGTYYLVEQTREANIIKALSKRVGISAIDYSLVEIDCTTMKMRGLGESENTPPTTEKPTQWFSLVPGSSKSDLANFACK